MLRRPLVVLGMLLAVSGVLYAGIIALLSLSLLRLGSLSGVYGKIL
jgi:hypothetical protein